MFLLVYLCSRLWESSSTSFIRVDSRDKAARKEEVDAAVTAEAGSPGALSEWEGSRKEEAIPWPLQFSVFPETAALFEAEGTYCCATLSQTDIFSASLNRTSYFILFFLSTRNYVCFCVGHTAPCFLTPVQVLTHGKVISISWIRSLLFSFLVLLEVNFMCYHLLKVVGLAL